VKHKIELVPMAVQSAAEVDRAVSSAPGGPVGGFVISDQPILVDDSAVRPAAF
jgi:hypothetical protein